MTRQTWTAFTAAVVFVGLALALATVPVPFVNWGMGSTHDVLARIDGRPVIKISGLPTHPTTGQLDLTVVSVTPPGGRLSLPQALAAYWLPSRDTLPRDAVYSPGQSAPEVKAEEATAMTTAQDTSIVAALRAANVKVVEYPYVFSVTVGGPSYKRLLPGDLIKQFDGVNIPDRAALAEQIARSHKAGDKVPLTVIRGGKELPVTVVLSNSTTAGGPPAIGAAFEDHGYSYAPQISFDLGDRGEIGGPSAGLVFALGIYDTISGADLLAGRHVAGTGTITAQGEVGPIGGIQEKIAGAEAAGATVFLVPAGNCGDLAGVQTDMTLVRVEKLEDAIEALETPSGGSAPPLARCA